MTNTARRWLLAGAFTAAGIAGLAAYDAATQAAHAADKPPAAVDCPGGVVDRAVRLPKQASARAKAVVAEVTLGPARDETADQPATPPAPPAEPEAEPTHEPEPTSEPTTPAEEPTPEPTDEPATEPRTTEPAPTPEPTSDPVIEVPPVVIEVPPVIVTPPIEVETPPVVVAPTPTAEPTPTPEPVVITLPTTSPAPLPDADAVLVAPTPQPVSIPVLPVQLPVLIGPTAEHTTEPAATVGELPGAAVDLADAPPDCADRVRVAIHLDRDLISQLIDSLTAPADKAQAKAKPGCPSKPKPTPDASGCTGTTATTNAGSSTGQMVADTGTTLVPPALDRLEHARARSTIPATRHICVEPGPA